MLWRSLAVLALCALAIGNAGPAAADAPQRAPLPSVRPDGLLPTDPGHGLRLREEIGLSGRSGWLAVDLQTGAVFDAHDADGLFAPASVAKLPTALFALARLGVEHRFETRLRVTGPVEEGVLAGDLVLEGGSDPELDTDGLAELVDALAGAGVQKVAGRFLVDAGSAVDVPEIDPIQPEDVAYNPAVSGLNLNFNRVLLRWGHQAGPDRVSVTAKSDRRDPPVERVRVVSGPTGARFTHEMEQGAEVWRIAPAALRGEGSRWLPVKGPALYAGDVFRRLAAGRGIELAEPEAGQARSARVLARRLSRPLPDILREMLRYSTNLTAEVVGVAASAAGGRPPADLAASAARMNRWTARVSGLPPDDPGIGFANHSGLSLASRVAPSRLVALLRAAAEAGGGAPPGPAATLLRAYPIAADGDPADWARLEVRAKTGTMDRIRGLSGYVRTPGGRHLAFAVFSNHIEARRAPQAGVSRAWLNRARAFERALIRGWVARADMPRQARQARR